MSIQKIEEFIEEFKKMTSNKRKRINEIFKRITPFKKISANIKK